MDNDVWEYFVSVMTRALVASIIAAFVIGAAVRLRRDGVSACDWYGTTEKVTAVWKSSVIRNIGVA